MADIKYAKAIERLDEIMAAIENDAIDVDELASKVKEAVSLIKTCKSKLDKAELEVKQVVEELSSQANQKEG